MRTLFRCVAILLLLTVGKFSNVRGQTIVEPKCATPVELLKTYTKATVDCKSDVLRKLVLRKDQSPLAVSCIDAFHESEIAGQKLWRRSRNELQRSGCMGNDYVPVYKRDWEIDVAKDGTTATFSITLEEKLVVLVCSKEEDRWLFDPDATWRRHKDPVGELKYFRAQNEFYGESLAAYGKERNVMMFTMKQNKIRSKAFYPLAVYKAGQKLYDRKLKELWKKSGTPQDAVRVLRDGMTLGNQLQVLGCIYEPDDRSPTVSECLLALLKLKVSMKKLKPKLTSKFGTRDGTKFYNAFGQFFFAHMDTLMAGKLQMSGDTAVIKTVGHDKSVQEFHLIKYNGRWLVNGPKMVERGYNAKASKRLRHIAAQVATAGKVIDDSKDFESFASDFFQHISEKTAEKKKPDEKQKGQGE